MGLEKIWRKMGRKWKDRKNGIGNNMICEMGNFALIVFFKKSKYSSNKINHLSLFP